MRQPCFQDDLNSDSINGALLIHTRAFLSLSRLSNYARDLYFEIAYLRTVAYRQISFKLRHFLEFSNRTIKSNNLYKLEKRKNFFQQLQAKLYITLLSYQYCQSFVILGQVNFEKCPPQKFLIAKSLLVEEFFY